MGTVRCGCNAVQALLFFLAAHTSTFSAVVYSLLYRHANRLGELEVKQWGKSSYWLRQVPFWAFCAGSVFYLAGTLFLALSARPQRSAAMTAFYILTAAASVLGTLSYLLLPGLLGGLRGLNV